MHKNLYKTLITCILICVVLFSLFWWSELQKTTTAPSQTPYKIEVIFKSYNRPPAFWSTVGDGIIAAEKEFGVTCNITAPYYESDIDTQIKLVEDAIAKKPDAIILAATDYDRLAEISQKIVSSGILLVTVDSDVNASGRLAFVGTDNIEIGTKLAQLLQEQVGDDGKFAVISHVEGTTTATQRFEGLMQATKNAQERMVGFEYCGGSEELAREQAIEILTNNPDIKCMVGLNESSSLGIAVALEELGLNGKVSLVVCDSSEKQVQFLENGTIQACVIQSPFSMGYLSVANTVKLLNKQAVEEITYTDSVIIRKENLTSPEYQQLIIPFTA